MKTLNELYLEVIHSEEEKAAFAKAAKENALEAFAKERGCEASQEEIEAFLQEQQTKEGELSLDELDAVAGGCGGSDNIISQAASSASLVTASIVCI